MKGETELSTSRRGFLKKSAIAGAGLALETFPGLAASIQGPDRRYDGQAAPTGASQSTGSTDGTTEEFTRGLGLYPGDPRENFSPELVIEKS